jgi:hypothetical protein
VQHIAKLDCETVEVITHCRRCKRRVRECAQSRSQRSSTSAHACRLGCVARGAVALVELGTHTARHANHVTRHARSCRHVNAVVEHIGHAVAELKRRAQLLAAIGVDTASLCARARTEREPSRTSSPPLTNTHVSNTHIAVELCEFVELTKVRHKLHQRTRAQCKVFTAAQHSHSSVTEARTHAPTQHAPRHVGDARAVACRRAAAEFVDEYERAIGGMSHSQRDLFAFLFTAALVRDNLAQCARACMNVLELCTDSALSSPMRATTRSTTMRITCGHEAARAHDVHTRARAPTQTQRAEVSGHVRANVRENDEHSRLPNQRRLATNRREVRRRTT